MLTEEKRPLPVAGPDRANRKAESGLWARLTQYPRRYLAPPDAENARSANRDGLIRFGGVVLFLLFLILHLPAPGPLLSWLERGGLDPSWASILLQARQGGLRFGREIVFTYGPLGYLLFPVDPAKLVWSSLLSVLLLLPFGIVFLKKRSFIDLLFLLLFTLASSFCSAFELFAYLFPAMIWYILRVRTRWIRFGAVAYCGIMGATCVFIKFMCLPVVAFSLLLADILMLKRDKAALAIPTFLLFMPLIWCFPARQELSDLHPFFVGSWQISSGYNYAMSLCPGEAASPWWIVLFAVASAAMLAIVAAAGGEKGFRPSAADRVCRIALSVPILFVIFKYGIVRMDSTHIILAAAYLSAFAAFWAVDPEMAPKRRCALSMLCLLLTAGVAIHFRQTLRAEVEAPSFFLQNLRFERPACVLIVFAAAMSMYVAVKYAIFDRARRMWLCLLSGGVILAVCCYRLPGTIGEWRRLATARRDGTLPSGAAAASAADCFSSEIRPLLRSELKYSPRPVFQSYSAYTPLLLAWNAAHFEYDSGPDCVFYGVQEIDGKLPSAFDSLALLRIVNNYEPVPGTKLLRKKKHRPAAARLTENGTIRSGFYRKIDLPRNAPYIWATVEIQDSPAGFVLKTLVKPAAVLIRLELDDGRIAEHRIIPENCGVPFLLSPYLPSWDQVDALLEAKEQKLPGVASFSVCPVFYRDGSGYRGRGLGEWFFRKAITVRFYRMEQSSGR